MEASDPLKWLAERRDGFLVGGAILYGLGYPVRLLNASRYHLGDVPALDFQYVMSGIVPALILGLAWAAATSFFRWRAKLASVRILRWLIPVSLIGVFILLLSLPRIAGQSKWPYWVVGFLYASLFYLFLTAKSDLDWFDRTYKYVVLAYFCLVCLIGYLTIYPHLPRQLGGPQPRCAYVDLVRDEVAPPTLAELTRPVDMDKVAVTEKVVRSTKLEVYFANSDYLLVRAAIVPGGQKEADPLSNPNRLYELRKETIRAIQWCQ